MYKYVLEQLENRISARLPPACVEFLQQFLPLRRTVRASHSSRPYNRIIRIRVYTYKNGHGDLGPGKRSQRNNNIITGNARVLLHVPRYA